MNGDEAHGVRHISVAQPEFPNVGIGHWYLHPSLDRTDGVGEVCCGHVAAQQDLVTNDDRPDGARVFVGERDRRLDL